MATAVVAITASTTAERPRRVPSISMRSGIRSVPPLVVGPPWDHGAVTTVPPSMFGVPALRSEDPRFLTGRGRYSRTCRSRDALRAVFVRSIMPHARLEAVEADAARAMAGVVAVFAAADFDLAPMPPSGNVEGGGGGVLEGPFGREVLARDVVRFVGEPIALVVAETFASGRGCRRGRARRATIRCRP